MLVLPPNENGLRRNNFTDLDYGIIANGHNKSLSEGLTFACNDFSGTKSVDMAAGELTGVLSGGIRFIQADLQNDVNVATGNLFANSGSENDRDFRNELDDFQYLFNSQNNNEVIDEYSIGSIEIVTSDKNNCVSNYSIEPTVIISGPEKANLQNAISNRMVTYKSNLASFLNSGDSSLLPSLHQRRALILRDLQSILRSDLIDSSYSGIDHINLATSEIEHFESDIFAVNLNFSEAEFDAAYGLIDSISFRFSLSQNQSTQISEWEDLLYKIQIEMPNESNLFTLPSSKLITWSSLISIHDGPGYTMLRGLQNYYLDSNFVAYSIPEELPNERSSEEDPIGRDLKIYPNPSAGSLQIEGIVNFETPILFELFNSTGILLDKGIISYGKQRLDVSSFSDGMYIVRFLLRDRDVALKFILSK